MANILITGGAGYVGGVLVPQVLAQGHKVVVYDILFFGKEFLPLSNPNLTVVEGDIRDTNKLAKFFHGIDMVLHLACISNDPSFALDENLSKTINYGCFEPMVIAAKAAGVKRFIYCSSSSVYGVATVPEVTEETPLVPLTLYNKFKGMCEPLLFKHQDDDFVCVTIRPATICGYSPRMRLDLSVNILTNYAVSKGEIVVFGGAQERPNLHIQDMCDLYKLLLTVPSEKIQGQIFNAGYQNHTIAELAEMVKKVVENEFSDKKKVQIKVEDSNDKRSYRISSAKIAKILGFKPAHTVEDAVKDICDVFKLGKLKDTFTNDVYYNVRQIQAKQKERQVKE